MPQPIAARVADWLRRHGGQWVGASTPGPSEALPYPLSPTPINVALWVDESWLDITPFVYGQERSQIEIKRGRSDEASQVEVSVATFELNNRDGQFTPRNPTSPLYGKIGRNTKVRIRIGEDYRFTGEISEWPQRWAGGGADVWVPVEASGVLRRLTQGATPLKSTLYRGLTASAGLVAYWPCEDGDDATQIASAVGGPPMVWPGGTPPDLAASTVFDCSAPLPAIVTAAQFGGDVPSHSPVNAIQITMLLHVPTSSTDDEGIFRMNCVGTLQYVDLVYHTGGGDLELRVINDADTEILNTIHNTNIDGKLVRVVATFTTDGLDVDWALDVYTIGASTFSASGTLSSVPLPKIKSATFNPGGGLTGNVVIGHVTIHNNASRSQVTLADELDAFNGEFAADRIKRLCAEEGVESRLIGHFAQTPQMGPQLPAKLIDLLRECEAADGGVLYEPRDFLGLAYRTRESMYNQTAVLALDYTQQHLSSIEPTEDDQQTRNDITVSRKDGASARAVLESGALSVQAPPNGVGRYDEAVTLNLLADTGLADHAGWRLHVGTVDELRFPVLGLNLSRPQFTGNQDLTGTARLLDVGDRLVVENPPAWLPPGTITQLAQGFTEVLKNLAHTIDINCSPETPWGMVGVYLDAANPAATGARYAATTSTLAEDLDTTETGVDVATADGPLWAHNDGDYDINIGGEVMTVTAVAGASSPQTLTVIRSVNGVVKSHSMGAAVQLNHTTIYVP